MMMMYSRTDPQCDAPRNSTARGSWVKSKNKSTKASANKNR